MPKIALPTLTMDPLSPFGSRFIDVPTPSASAAPGLSLPSFGISGASTPDAPGLASLVHTGAGIGKDAAGAGTWLANILDMPGVADWLGKLGGPLSLVGGLTSGNPISAATGAVQTGSLISGELGGPTLMQLLANLGVDMSGGAIGATGLGAMAAIPLMMGTALWQGGQNLAKQQQMAQGFERDRYAKEWPNLTAARTAGAGLFDQLPQATSEGADAIRAALQLATHGIRATDLASGYENLTGTEGGKANDLAAWAAKAPQLEGQNWGSWLGAMDAANAAGIDAGAMQGASIGGLAKRPGVHEAFKQFLSGPKGDLTSDYLPSGHQEQRIADYHTTPINLLGGRAPVVTDPFRANDGEGRTSFTTYEPGKVNGTTTQEAQDISNAIAGVGQQLGIDWGARGNGQGGQNQGYTILPEQLAEYGFTPGNYGAATLNYLKNLDPNVINNPNWATYSKNLAAPDAGGAERAAVMPTATLATAPLTGNPFSYTDQWMPSEADMQARGFTPDVIAAYTFADQQRKSGLGGLMDMGGGGTA